MWALQICSGHCQQSSFCPHEMQTHNMLKLQSRYDQRLKDWRWVHQYAMSSEGLYG